MIQDKVHFTVQGEGRPILLIHGIASSGNGWSLLGPALAKQGYRVFMPDLPGHGDSHKPERAEHYHIQKIYAVLEQWIESLTLNEQFCLVGHSLGGNLSLQYALNNPQRLNGMVLIDPFYSPYQLFPFIRWLQQKAAIGTGVLRRTSEPFLRKTLRWNHELTKQMAEHERWRMVADLHRASPMILHILPTVPDLTPVLSDIQTPAQVIWGSRDRTLMVTSFPKLVAKLPNASGYEVIGGSHQPHLTQSNIVTPLVLNYLNRIAPANQS